MKELSELMFKNSYFLTAHLLKAMNNPVALRTPQWPDCGLQVPFITWKDPGPGEMAGSSSGTGSA